MPFPFTLRREPKPSRWTCSWCDYVNIRFHTGLDHCGACGAETLTRRGMENEIVVKYSLNPNRLRRFTHLDCVGTKSCKVAIQTSEISV